MRGHGADERRGESRYGGVVQRKIQIPRRMGLREERLRQNRGDLEGMEGDDGFFADRLSFDPSEPPSGEYVYGCAMVPAQWVLHVLGMKEAQ